MFVVSGWDYQLYAWALFCMAGCSFPSRWLRLYTWSEEFKFSKLWHAPVRKVFHVSTFVRFVNVSLDKASYITNPCLKDGGINCNFLYEVQQYHIARVWVKERYFLLPLTFTVCNNDFLLNKIISKSIFLK